jgi:hypothetical protein
VATPPADNGHLSAGRAYHEARTDILRHVNLWLADQSHSSMPAWLSSPTVAILGLLATVISILQAGISTYKWFINRTEKPSSQRRLAISAAAMSIIAIMVLCPLTWWKITETDAKTGDPHWAAGLYPVTVFVPAIMAALFLLNFEFRRNGRIMSFAVLAITLCFALPTAVYDTSVRSIWDRYLVSVIPGIAVAMLLAMLLAHFIPRAEKEDDAPDRPPPSEHHAAIKSGEAASR